MNARQLLCLLAFQSLAAVPLNAQTCFRGRPLPSCTRFWIAESGLAVQVDRHVKTGLLATLEIGMMQNRSRTVALGGTAIFGVAEQATGNAALIGLKPRFRRWLGRTLSLDLSPGGYYVLHGEGNSNTFGLTGSGAVGLGDWAALNAQVLIGRSPLNTSTETRLYLGGKLGSYAGAVGAVGGSLIALIVVLVGLSGD